MKLRLGVRPIDWIFTSLIWTLGGLVILDFIAGDPSAMFLMFYGLVILGPIWPQVRLYRTFSKLSDPQLRNDLYLTGISSQSVYRHFFRLGFLMTLLPFLVFVVFSGLIVYHERMIRIWSFVIPLIYFLPTAISLAGVGERVHRISRGIQDGPIYMVLVIALSYLTIVLTLVLISTLAGRIPLGWLIPPIVILLAFRYGIARYRVGVSNYFKNPEAWQ